MSLWWRWLVLCWPLLSWTPTWAAEAEEVCTPRVLAMQAARSEDGARPAQGWESVTLPDRWTQRWPDYDGSVWYRIDWENRCTGANQSAGAARMLAMGIDGMSMAGEVFINREQLWRDESLQEPLSRSWNMPRWWLLPASSLNDGVNSVWVHVVGLSALSPGLGVLRIDSAQRVAKQYQRSLWSQRTVYFISAIISAMAGGLFLLVWFLRRQEYAYGWFGLMSLAWLLYVASFLADSPWPWSDTLTRSRVSITILILYVLCACMFTFRFGEQKLPYAEWALWGGASVGIGAALLGPKEHMGQVFIVLWLGALAVLLINCIQFQWHAWRPRAEGRKLPLILLAMCWLVMLGVTLHDMFMVLGDWQVARTWTAVSEPLIVTLMTMLLAGQLTQQMRNVEQFNRDLMLGVERARSELAQALQREHEQELNNTKLQERMQIAHDLHDGLGNSLMLSMALVELAPQPLPNERVLSLLKVLRDDLRQVIDQASCVGVQVPETPVQWVAPLRHRFISIFDDMEMASQWNIALQWKKRPSAQQCLEMTRLLEEALSNTLKHSRARQICVACWQPQPDTLILSVEDDGVGFDVQAVQHAGLSVGMRSMMKRAERIGGRLTVESSSAGSKLVLELMLF